MKTGFSVVPISVVLVILAVSGLLPFAFAKGNPAMSKPLIDTRVPSLFHTATFAMG